MTIFLSADFYFAGLVVFGNAADARLPFYATTALSMFTFISVIELKKKWRRHSARTISLSVQHELRAKASTEFGFHWAFPIH